jgi:hypothetical protein
MKLKRKWILSLCAVLAIFACVFVDSRRSIREVQSRFDEIKELIDAKRYDEVYALTPASYRAKVSLSDFIGYERWRGNVAEGELQVSAWLGRGSVRVQTTGDMSGFWRMGFERLGGEWHYVGDRTFYLHKF